MERLRQVWGQIGKQLGQLSVSQRLLIASMVVIVLMTLFLVSQYAGAPKYAEVITTGTPEDQERAHSYLIGVGFEAEIREGKVVVPAERQYAALAQLGKARVLPDDKELMFRNLVEKQNMFMPKGQINQMYMTALTNELTTVIRSFDGVEDAKVFVSAPESVGIGVAAKKPVAQVTVFMKNGRSALDQRTVDALADVVAGAVAGLDIKNVAIIEGTSRRRYRANGPDEMGGQTYIEQVAAVEDRVRQKIEDHLGAFIGGAVVSVNAMVDGSKRETQETKYANKGEGTVSVPMRETNSSSTSNSASQSAEPGLGSNIGLSINSGGGAGGNSTNTETTENESTVKIGSKTTVQQDPRGRPTKINVTVSVPREYVVEILKGRSAGGAASGGDAATGSAGEPTDADVEKEWAVQLPRLVSMIRPMVDTKDVPGTVAEVGEVVVSMMPLAMANLGHAPGNQAGIGGAVSSGGGGMLSGLLGKGMIKQVVLSVLALLALGMMFVLVRRNSKPQELPTAEELVGIPPALHSDNELVGEADESDTAMTGIEVDSDALKTGKMLEEVQELVHKNPQAAATVFSRWLATED